MDTNTRPVQCRYCEKVVPPGEGVAWTGQPLPIDVSSRRYLCKDCHPVFAAYAVMWEDIKPEFETIQYYIGRYTPSEPVNIYNELSRRHTLIDSVAYLQGQYKLIVLSSGLAASAVIRALIYWWDDQLEDVFWKDYKEILYYMRDIQITVLERINQIIIYAKERSNGHA